MKESVFRSKLVKILKPLHAVPVENAVCPGTPDISYAGGWIELKVDEWNKKGELPLKLLTPQQRVWMHKRWSVTGEMVSLAVLVHDCVMILPALHILDCQNKDKNWWSCLAATFQLRDQEKICDHFTEASRRLY